MTSKALRRRNIAHDAERPARLRLQDAMSLPDQPWPSKGRLVRHGPSYSLFNHLCIEVYISTKEEMGDQGDVRVPWLVPPGGGEGNCRRAGVREPIMYQTSFWLLVTARGGWGAFSLRFGEPVQPSMCPCGRI